MFYGSLEFNKNFFTTTLLTKRKKYIYSTLPYLHYLQRYTVHYTMSFSSNKAPGFDKVTMSVIKDALPCVLPVLTDIVNRSLLSSVFPAAWKVSEVISLPKDGDHEIPNNNRPVSLLPAASKICERVALNQLMT